MNHSTVNIITVELSLEIQDMPDLKAYVSWKFSLKTR